MLIAAFITFAALSLFGLFISDKLEGIRCLLFVIAFTLIIVFAYMLHL